MSDPKEPHFFGRDDGRSLAWYSELFSAVRHEKAVGEGSTSYTRPDLAHVAAEAVRELLPDCRLIYIVRHPLRRLESDWRMRRREGWGTPSIVEAVMQAFAELDNDLEPLAELDRLLPQSHPRFDPWWKRLLLTQGLYWQNLRTYRQLFPEGQLLTLFLEDLAEKPEEQLLRCWRHVGVDPPPTPHQLQVLNRSGRRQDGWLARRLRRFPLVRSTGEVLPARVRTLVKRVLTRRVEYSITWDQQTVRRLADWYRGDSSKFLEWCGKPPDFWAWDP